jgi:hypothetical protein
MKTMKRVHLVLSLLTSSLLILSCQKDALNSSTPSSLSGSSVQSAIASLQAISVAAGSSASTAAADSIYVIHTCSGNQHRDSVSFSALPSGISDYLSANYSGYTFQKAYAVNDSTGTVQGYVIIIKYSGKPVGLAFDANGSFVKVLEQREGRDLFGRGWHEGGHFEGRDGRNKDTVAIASLPAAITSYMAGNYPQDTILRAFKNPDGTYTVLSRNNGAFATVFGSDGTFVKRVQLPSEKGSVHMIEEANLPSSISIYLSATYPGYTFKQAFTVSANNTLLGYIVFIDANNTRYAVSFDASGNFLKSVTIR